MRFSELYTDLKKKLQFNKDNINIEKIPEEDLKKLVQLCNSQERVSVYQQSKEGNILELGLELKDEYPTEIIFEKLKILRIYKAMLTDTSFLTNYEDIEALTLEYCGLIEVPDLSNQKNLTDLSFFGNKIKKIEGIDHLVRLEHLSFAYNDIRKLEGLETFKNLISINLMANKFSKLEGLENLVNVELLGLEENPNLKGIEGLSHFKKAKEIGLSMCAIEEVNGLREFEGFNDLYFLTLWKNKITEFEVKVILPKLRELSLRENKISRVKLDGNLPSLEELDLNENGINEIEGISNLPNLRRLNLDENKFTKLENLSNLPRLTHVSIHQTPVKTVKNIELPEGCWIHSFLIERFTEEERKELDQQLKLLGLRPDWMRSRDYWD